MNERDLELLKERQARMRAALVCVGVLIVLLGVTLLQVLFPD